MDPLDELAVCRRAIHSAVAASVANEDHADVWMFRARIHLRRARELVAALRAEAETIPLEPLRSEFIAAVDAIELDVDGWMRLWDDLIAMWARTIDEET